MKKIYLLLFSMFLNIALFSQTTKEDYRGGCPTYLPNNYTILGSDATVDVSVLDSTWYPYYLHWSPLNDQSIVNVSDTLYNFPDSVLQINDLTPGVKYIVKTRDKWMCGSWDTIQSPCVMNCIVHKVSIPGACDSVWYEVEGGTGPFTLSVTFNGGVDPFVSQHPSSPFGKPDYCNADYEAIITDANGCSDTLWFNPTLLKINDISSEIEFNMYPNPADNLLILSAKEILNSVEVYNMSGVLIIETMPDNRDVTLDVSSLTKGIYMVKTKSKLGMAVKRFVKN